MSPALRQAKDRDDLIRMLQILDDRNIHLWLLGIGPEQVALEQLAEALGVEDQVHFKGFQEDVGSFFANSHLFVTASQLDSLPNSLIEAHAAGLPIVAYDSMGIPEIVSDSQTGFLSPTHTPEALSKLCNKLLVNETLNTQFATAARERVRKMFDREQQNQKFCSTIESIFAESSALLTEAARICNYLRHSENHSNSPRAQRRGCRTRYLRNWPSASAKGP